MAPYSDSLQPPDQGWERWARGIERWARDARRDLSDVAASWRRAAAAVDSLRGCPVPEWLAAQGVEVRSQATLLVGMSQAEAGVIVRGVVDARQRSLVLYEDVARETAAALQRAGVEVPVDVARVVLAHEAYHLLASSQEDQADELAAHLFATLATDLPIFAGELDSLVLEARRGTSGSLWVSAPPDRSSPR